MCVVLCVLVLLCLLVVVNCSSVCVVLLYLVRFGMLFIVCVVFCMCFSELNMKLIFIWCLILFGLSVLMWVVCFVVVSVLLVWFSWCSVVSWLLSS